MTVAPAPKRRAILKGAAWSTPVIAAAIGAPAASASGSVDVANSYADYYWGQASAASGTSLKSTAGSLTVVFDATMESTLSSLPRGAWFNVHIEFTKDVFLVEVPDGWTLDSPNNGASKSYGFQQPLGWRHSLSTVKFTAADFGLLEATTRISVTHGGDTTWTMDSDAAAAVLEP